MAKDGGKSKGHHKNKKKKAAKSPPLTSNNHLNTPSNQADKEQQQAHSRSYYNNHLTVYQQEHPNSYATELADDTATAAWSHLEIQGYDTTSQTLTLTPEYTMTGEAYAYELGRWAYETSHENLTLAERLEKGKWETERLERL